MIGENNIFKNILIKFLYDVIEHTKHVDNEVFVKFNEILARVIINNDDDLQLCKLEDEIDDAYLRYVYNVDKKNIIKTELTYIIEFKDNKDCIFSSIRSKYGILDKKQINFLNSNKISFDQVNILSEEESNCIRSNWFNNYMNGLHKYSDKNKRYTIKCHKCKNTSSDEDLIWYSWNPFINNNYIRTTTKHNFLKLNLIKERSLIIDWEINSLLLIEIPYEIVININFKNKPDICIYPRNLSWTFNSNHEGYYNISFNPNNTTLDTESIKFYNSLILRSKEYLAIAKGEYTSSDKFHSK